MNLISATSITKLKSVKSLNKIRKNSATSVSGHGTMTFTSAIMGLLGMDVFQDELTDKVFGDLVLGNHLVKMADDIYFDADTLHNFVKLFKTILDRIDTADLRIKPSKLKLNVQSADILGLHWSKGSLSPSSHKLDPLAHCEPPKTAIGLDSASY